MLTLFETADGPGAAARLPLTCVPRGGQGALPPAVAAWAEANGFKGEAGAVLLLPGNGGDAPGGALGGALLGVGDGDDPFVFGACARRLPADTVFALEGLPAGLDPTLVATAWALGAYRFARYRSAPEAAARLLLPDGTDGAEASRIAAAVTLTRDLVNTPTHHMGPGDLANAARALADEHGGSVRVIEGDDLLEQNYPMVHAVGRAATTPPCLIDLTWGDTAAPRVTLVGKGVCFDSGGLDIKPASAMRLMKKDMGGAANVLGLAAMIMDAGLKVRLRVLIPAVENAIAGNAFRPGDVLPTRKGLTVEIGNTDAEGRLVLADALAEADAETPDLLIDMATLTGAARVALGPDLPACFTDDEALAADLARHGAAQADPVWRLPLWMPYMSGLESRIADLNNIADGPFAGSIVAGLFLKRFVTRTPAWVHLDIFAWNPKARPGRPAGGEAMAIRALFALMKERYGA